MTKRTHGFHVFKMRRPGHTTLEIPWHRDCYVGGMMTFLLTGLALVAPGVIVELIAAVRAPVGYQDENGFHFGHELAAKAEQFERENAS